ncbi:MAG: universal stress protein [Deltaproteobacteria bacterium]|nr:universal stress protein [Deltaproteobacteria bacterium]
MDEIKRILVLSRSTKHCKKAVDYGISLAKKYGTELYVLHVFHNPFGLEGWNVPLASLPDLEAEYKKMQQDAIKNINEMIASEQTEKMPIDIIIREGDPNKELFTVIDEKNIDLLIFLAHSEGRLEHLLTGKSNEEIIRKMPCSLIMVKQESKAVP